MLTPIPCSLKLLLSLLCSASLRFGITRHHGAAAQPALIAALCGATGQGRSWYQQWASHHLPWYRQRDVHKFSYLQDWRDLGHTWVVPLPSQSLAALAPVHTGHLQTLVGSHGAGHPGSRQGGFHVDVWLLLLLWSIFNVISQKRVLCCPQVPGRQTCWSSRLPLGIGSSKNTCGVSLEYESYFSFPLREKEVIFQ